jgi:hypothetical protein
MEFGPTELDILSRAFYRALDHVGPRVHDKEEAKAILMAGILGAARRGERNEDKLVRAALAAILTPRPTRSAA